MNKHLSSRRFVSAAIALVFAVASLTFGVSRQRKGVKDDSDSLNFRMELAVQTEATNSSKKPRVTVTDIGPELGISYAIEGFVINPLDRQQIILPSQTGIFKSTDGGSNWRRLKLAPNDNMLEIIVSVRHDPRDPLSVYAVTNNPGVFGWGLFHSSDFGETWQILLGIPDHLVDSAPHPTQPNVVFALQRTAHSFMPDVELGSGLIKSVDGEGFFYVTENGLPEIIFDSETATQIANPIFTSMAISPADPSLMYVASPFDTLGYYPGGVYKSEDGGQSFVRLETSPPEALQIFPHPTDRNTLFVQAQGEGFVTGMYRSTDGGNNFEEVTSGLPAERFNFFLAFDPHNPAVVYIAGEGGLFRSQDGGLTFLPTGLRESQVGVAGSTLSVDPANSNIIYVNTSLGNFKSVNGGATFQPINRGWRATSVSHITFDGSAQPNLYISTALGNGLFKRPGGRKNFEALLSPVPQTALSVSWISSLAVAPTDPELMIALSRTNGVFRSTNGGQSWQPSQLDTNQNRFTASSSEVVFDPTNGANVYIACGNSPSTGFYRSIDGGLTFMRSFVLPSLAESAFSDLALNPFKPDTIYTGSVAFLSDSPLLKSLNGGLDFTATTIFATATIRDIAVDPRDPQTIYVSGAFETEFDFHVILRSDDGGATFSAADDELTGNLVAIALDPINTHRLFAWTWDGLFISENRGASWTLLDNDEAMRRAAFFGTSMTLNPRNPNLIYLAGASVLEVELKQ